MHLALCVVDSLTVDMLLVEQRSGGGSSSRGCGAVAYLKARGELLEHSLSELFFCRLLCARIATFGFGGAAVTAGNPVQLVHTLTAYDWVYTCINMSLPFMPFCHIPLGGDPIFLCEHV